MTDNTKKWPIFVYGCLTTLSLFAVLYFFTAEKSAAPDQATPTHSAASKNGAPLASKSSRTSVQLTSPQTQAIDLHLATVTKENLLEELRVVATVVPDESRIAHIHTRVAGWIEKLHVTNTGERVTAGQTIAEIYSQELFASQIEYLAARELSGPASILIESGRHRLRFLGMSDAEILEIEKNGKPHRLVKLIAPRSGILAHRGIAVGTSVDPSTEIAIILDLSRVWVLAEVPEAAASLIQQGMTANLELGPAKTKHSAKIELIDPLLTETTRTLKVRFSLPNPKGNLRPGTYGSVHFLSPPRSALMVAREAVTDTGNTQYVYVQTAEHVYEPRIVRLGVRQKNQIEIVAGLSEGERIVISGVFLLDSESRLRASGSAATAHGAHAQSAKSEPANSAPMASAAHSEQTHTTQKQPQKQTQTQRPSHD